MLLQHASVTPESPWRRRHRCCCQTSTLVCTSYLGGRDIQRREGGKKEKRTAFFTSLTAHYHGNSPGPVWLAGPPLPFTGANNTIRREHGGEMRVQYCIQSIIVQLHVFSCRMGRSVLGAAITSSCSVLMSHDCSKTWVWLRGCARVKRVFVEWILHFLQLYCHRVGTVERVWSTLFFKINKCLMILLNVSVLGLTEPTWSCFFRKHRSIWKGICFCKWTLPDQQPVLSATFRGNIN